MLTVTIFLGKILSSQTKKKGSLDYLHCFMFFKELFHAYLNQICCVLKSASIFQLL